MTMSTSRHDKITGRSAEQLIVEDFPEGYPRYCALIEAHPGFHIFRRFSKLRARLILRKQDRLSILEQELEDMDHAEEVSLFLASNRLDSNDRRQSVLDEIERVLQEYDDLIEKDRGALNSQDASCRDVGSLKNWIAGNPCLARDDSAYLSRRDLFRIAEHDGAISVLEGFVEDLMINSFSKILRHCWNKQSRDPNVYLPAGAWVGRLARLLIAVAVIVTLLTPVLICYYVVGSKARIIIVAVSTIVCITTLIMTVQARTIEVIVAGTTYATVLTVFVSGNTSKL